MLKIGEHTYTLRNELGYARHMQAAAYAGELQRLRVAAFKEGANLEERLSSFEGIASAMGHYVALFVQSWSHETPVTAEAVQELPRATVDQLFAACNRVFAGEVGVAEDSPQGEI